LIKQGAKLTATWEDVWEELPSDVKAQFESQTVPAASDNRPTPGHPVPEDKLLPGGKKVLGLLKEHEATQMDEIIKKFEGQLSSAEIFTALFDLEMSGRIKQLPGKNFVKSF